MSTSSDIKHKGIITSITPLKVEILCEEACTACRAKGACSLGSKQRREITRIVPPRDWTPKVGQEVDVVMSTRMGFKAVWLAMGIPFLLLMVVVVICVLCHLKEWLMGICAVGVTGFYYFVVYLLKDSIRNDFNIILHNTEP